MESSRGSIEVAVLSLYNIGRNETKPKVQFHLDRNNSFLYTAIEINNIVGVL